MSSDLQEDNLVEEFGYKPAYERVFKSIGSMSLTLAMASPMLGVFLQSPIQLTYGGYWGLTWGWVIPAVAFFPWALATAELASSMPVNGTSYWWVAALAPPNLSRPLSFVTGITNLMYAITSVASFAWAMSQTLITVIGIYSGWEATTGASLGISIAVCVLWVAMACMRMQDSNTLYICNGKPKQDVIMFMSLNVGVLATATIVLITTAIFIIGMPASHAARGLPFTSATNVFGSFDNFSDWDIGVAAPYTFLSAAWIITGWNAPATIAEETHGARKVVPRSIVTVYSAMAIMGFFVLLILAFCINDLEAAVSDPSGVPAYTLVMDRWGLKLGFTFLMIVAINTMVGGAAVIFMLSCQTAAFARDGGLLWNDKLTYIWPYSKMPIFSSILVSGGGAALLFLAFSPIASSIIYSLAVMTLNFTYALPMVFRIFNGGRWIPGPWHYGKMSIPIHAWSILSIAYITILECFPPSASWTASTFNYNWVVLIGAVILAWVMWIFKGSKLYRGVDQEALRAWRAHHPSSNTANDDRKFGTPILTGVEPVSMATMRASSSSSTTKHPKPTVN
ncbi:unnamed protein product [Fusarium equiseti]|uniref:Amino acid transporter n=1 Tax=Fusarium equiseti TaxID=61235 RepID=A0A8J2J8L6_FUSEQ|nr:unnamed protein product [Fusarium equiseti]